MQEIRNLDKPSEIQNPSETSPVNLGSIYEKLVIKLEQTSIF